MNLSLEATSLPISVILDGEIINENLPRIGWNEEQLMQELKKRDVQSPKDILYAEWQEGSPLYVQSY